MQRIETLVPFLAPESGGTAQLRTRRLRLVVVGGVLLGALLVGGLGRPALLGGALLGAAAAPVILFHPAAAIVALPWLAMYLPLTFQASSSVAINISVVIVPVLLMIWLLRMVGSRQTKLVRSRLYLPMIGVILSASLSWVLGNVYWNPGVPRAANIVLVQLGQWGVFVFSMLAMMMGLNLLNTSGLLHATVVSYVAAGATAVILHSIPLTAPLAEQLVQLGSVDSLYWVWMNSLLLGYLLFRSRLRPPVSIAAAILWLLLWRLAMDNRGWMSGMIPMAVSTLALLVLRLRKRFLYLLPVLIVIAILAVPVVREALNLDRELATSGAGRLNHMRIIMTFAVKKPWFGLGLAAYRHYTVLVPQMVKSLLYSGAPVSSHNNYVDIFAQMGIVGVAAFTWLVAVLGRTLIRAAEHHSYGVQAVFANASAAAFAGMLASGMLGDWFLPFVYNIGLNGMRTSITSWILFGAAAGLAATSLGRRRGIEPDQPHPRGAGDGAAHEVV